jgi:hypothetical protein
MPAPHPVTVFETPRSRWTGGLVHGLGDPLADALVLDTPLSAWRDSPVEPHPGVLHGPAFLLGADLWVSPDFCQRFMDASQYHAQGKVTRLARDAQGPGRFADPLSRLARSADGSRILFDAWFIPAGCTLDASDAAALDAATGVDLVVGAFAMALPADPEVLGGGATELSLMLSRTACSPVSHWVELQRTNLLALPVRTHGNRAWGILRYLWAAARAGTLRPARVSALLNTHGEGCRIHPSAVLEGCRLGNHVEVGPGAVVRGSRLSDGVVVGPQALVDLSVVGRDARIQRRAMVTASVVYPQARVGGVVQLGVCGRNSSNKMFSVGTDMRLGGPVRVTTPDGLRPVDLGYQGVCFGHDSFVGSGVWIAPGRVIEAGRKITRRKDEMVT